MRLYKKGWYEAELPDGHGYTVPVEIWEVINPGLPKVKIKIAIATDKFCAMNIIDALYAKHPFPEAINDSVEETTTQGHSGLQECDTSIRLSPPDGNKRS